jgi:hypothetical protein
MPPAGRSIQAAVSRGSGARSPPGRTTSQSDSDRVALPISPGQTRAHPRFTPEGRAIQVGDSGWGFIGARLQSAAAFVALRESRQTAPSFQRQVGRVASPIHGCARARFNNDSRHTESGRVARGVPYRSPPCWAHRECLQPARGRCCVQGCLFRHRVPPGVGSSRPLKNRQRFGRFFRQCASLGPRGERDQHLWRHARPNVHTRRRQRFRVVRGRD